MADKGSTLLNGTATISQPEVQKPSVRSYPAEPEQKNVKLWTIGGGAALMLFSYVLLTWVPSDWTWEMLRIFGVLLVLNRISLVTSELETALRAIGLGRLVTVG